MYRFRFSMHSISQEMMADYRDSPRRIDRGLEEKSGPAWLPAVHQNYHYLGIWTSLWGMQQPPAARSCSLLSAQPRLLGC